MRCSGLCWHQPRLERAHALLLAAVFVQILVAPVSAARPRAPNGAYGASKDGEQDDPFPHVVTFTPGNSQRTNLCKRQGEIAAGNRTLNEALVGMHFKVVVPRPNNGYIRKGKDGNWKGYDVELLASVAKQAQFKFDIVEVKYAKNKHKESQFVEMNKAYDIVLDNNADVAKREQLQVDTIYNTFDASQVLVTNRGGSTDASVNLLDKLSRIAAPYDKLVWFTYIAFCVGSGILYFFLEAKPQRDQPVDESKFDTAYPDYAADPRYYDHYYDESQPHSMGLAVYIAFMHSTTLVNFSPRTWPGRILVMSWTASSLMFVAGYTANLAAILAMESAAKVHWNDIGDVLHDKARICARRSGYDLMLERYPTYTKTVLSEMDPIKDMIKGKCEAAVVWQSNFEVALLSEEANRNCDLKSIGPKLTDRLGGWSAFKEHSEKCTGLVLDVLHLHLERMHEKGTLDRFYQEKLLQAETTLKTPCGSKPKPSESSMGLKLSSMAGLFLFHFFWASVACVVYCSCPCGRSPTQCS